MSQRLPVLLVTSNGVGMGHLTRQLTVALSAPDTLDPVLMSLSGALPTVRTAVAAGRLPELAGVRTEYCPSRKSGWLPKGGPSRRLRELHPAYGWEPYVADRLRALVAETGATLDRDTWRGIKWGRYQAAAARITRLPAAALLPPLVQAGIPMAVVSNSTRAEVDLNVVMQEGGNFVEIQGTGEHGLFGREQLNGMLDVAQKGCSELIAAQKAALGW